MENRPVPLITAEELKKEMEAGELPLLIDVRAADRFARGQIEHAVHLDLWGVSLIDTSDAPLRAFMWMIAHLFELRGVTQDRAVVVYEDDSGIRAARAFWFLEYLGHPRVRLLDGGVRAWTAAGYGLSRDPVAPVPASWSYVLQPDRIATWREVADRLDAPDTVIVDTRSEGEHSGRVVRAKRGGAIPGAVHLEWTENLSPDGRFKPSESLRAMYEAAGVTADRRVITYCQGGYRAAHTYLALRVLGFPSVQNYTGSWKEWGDREDLPIETPSGVHRADG